MNSNEAQSVSRPQAPVWGRALRPDYHGVDTRRFPRTSLEAFPQLDPGSISGPFRSPRRAFLLKLINMMLWVGSVFLLSVPFWLPRVWS